MSKFVLQWSLQGVLVLIGFGIDLIPKVETWAYSIALWSVAFIWAIVTIIFWVKSRRRINTVQQINEQADDNRIANLLRELDGSMTKLANKAVKGKIVIEEIDEITTHVAEALGIITENEIENIIKDLKRRPSIKRMRKSELIKLIHSKLPDPQQREFTPEDMVKIGRTLDGKEKGLAKLRDTDRYWQRLYNELRSIKLKYSDAELNTLIDDTICLSYGINSLLLYIEYLKKHVPIEYFPPVFIQLGAGLDKIDRNIEMDKQITKVVNRIKKLKTMSNETHGVIIKDTKVKFEAEKVDKATGMEVNRPARLDNVEVDMVAKDVGEATGFKTTQVNAETGMFVGTFVCSCGKSFSYTSVGYRPSSVTCPHCGKEYKQLP